jgi:DNA-binding response OmpR family regulator
MSTKSSAAAPIPILVAEDEDTVRNVLCLYLKEQGYEVHEAADGVEALEVAKAVQPRLVILDITMPKMNGWEVARRLRKASDTADIKLLMLSGIGRDVLCAGLPVLGGDMGLDKPFELEELEEAMQTLLASNSSGAC